LWAGTASVRRSQPKGLGFALACGIFAGLTSPPFLSLNVHRTRFACAHIAQRTARSFLMGNRNRRPARRDLSAERQEFLQSLKGRSNSRDRHAVDHRALMFCRQVQRTLAMALAGEVGDDLLQQLSVESVQPAPTCNHLLVAVGVPDGMEISLSELLDRLN